ncbi:MAG: tetratricopeptide repeat protein, partial [Spirochaetaceae bacterium]|nr:tetratricopeptide repeat protein [Spirochaetaceae bacterium]
KAAAYTQVKLGNVEEAKKLYAKVLEMEPEQADNGVNYATILFAMEKPAEAEETLQKYESTILDDKDALLLLARVQQAQKKPEAIDSYDLWLSKNNDPQVRYEYTLALENGGFYARALEEARKSLSELIDDTETLKRSSIRFVIARLILVSDPENPEGVTELAEAIRGGFADKDAIDALLIDERLTQALQDEARRTIDNAKTTTPSDSGEKAPESGSLPGSGDNVEAGSGGTSGTSGENTGETKSGDGKT